MGCIRYASLGFAFLLGACTVADPGNIDPPGSGNTETITLSAGDDGAFEYCDDSGDCTTLPNPDDCATLVIEIDTATGDTCETCEDADGTAISSGCDETQVECMLITLPEPDCVVCAYVGGAVVYSSCTVTEPDNCELYYPWSDDALACEVCFDDAGNVISDECPGGCDDMVCPAIACAPGFIAVTRPGECCSICVVDEDCDDVTCAEVDYIPECPPGSIMVQDPVDCCGWYCEPVECPPVAGSSGSSGAPDIGGCATDMDCGGDFACVDGMCLTDDCPAGFAREWDFPSCGACVPVDDTRYCFSDFECAADEICTVDEECLFLDCGCYGECDADGTCWETCTDCACQGICRPSDWICPDLAPPVGECDGGFWDYPGRDEYGCPLPPICICYDGAFALDGLCVDTCANYDCPAVEIICEPGFHTEFGYPYCCGICVPDDDCWTASAEQCFAVDCAPGYHCEVGPACEPLCLPDDPSCYGDMDCGPEEFCSTSWGDCFMPPECEPDSSGDPVDCVTVCAGYCVPAEPLYCYSSEDCAVGEICTTEIGDCMAPPECYDPDMPCPDVCTGVCEPQLEPNECEPEACGPPLGMPNYECDDGTIGGPSGRCLLTADGACGWEVIDCP